MMFGGKKLSNRDKMLMPFIGVGFELFILSIGAIYLGGIIDKKYDLGGVGTIVLFCIVLASWIFHLTILMKQVKKNLEINDDN